MTFLPIVERELRVAARRTGYYWSRVAAAGAALVIGLAIHRSMRGANAADIGTVLFGSLGWLTLATCLLAGAGLTADRLSEERREGTLGLLFLTDLRGHDVVLGKLAAAALPALYQLLAILPLLVLSLLFGGITMPQVLKVSASLLATLLLSLSIGLAWSAWFTSGTRAMVTIQLTLLGLTAGPWLLALVWFSKGNSPGKALPDWLGGLLHVSPAATLVLAQAAPGLPPVLPSLSFAASLACQLALASLCLVFASLLVPRIWQDRTEVGASSRSWTGWRNRPFGRHGKGRSDWLDVNPFAWLSCRDRWPSLSITAGVGLLVAVVLWGNLYHRNTWAEWSLNPLLSILAHAIIKGWAALAAVRRLAEDKRSGALELLLSTPLTPGELKHGQFLALGRQLAVPLAIILPADLALCAQQFLMSQWDADLDGLFYAARLAMLGVDLAAIAVTGLWLALTARRANQAALGVLSRVLVAPWLIILGILLVGELTGLSQRIELTERRLLAMWFVVGLATDLWLIGRCGQRFQNDLREEAARSAPPPGWLRTHFEVR